MDVRRPTAMRVQEIAPFHVMEVQTAARALEATGRDVVHMEIGEPDFPTPAPVLAAARAALEGGGSPFGMDSGRFCREALAHTGVAFTPGIDFGAHRAGDHVRFAYTIAIDRLREGVRRLAAWLPGLGR